MMAHDWAPEKELSMSADKTEMGDCRSASSADSGDACSLVSQFPDLVSF